MSNNVKSNSQRKPKKNKTFTEKSTSNPNS